MICRPSEFQNAKSLRLRATKVEGKTSRVESAAHASFFLQKRLPGDEDPANVEIQGIWQQGFISQILQRFRKQLWEGFQKDENWDNKSQGNWRIQRQIQVEYF